jgi:hypothetical protein
MKRFSFYLVLTLCALFFFTDAMAQTNKKYQEMSEAEQLAFIERQGQRLTQSLTVNGNSPLSFGRDAAIAVKPFVDKYAKRVGNKATNNWQEDLNFVFARAVNHTSDIASIYNEQNLPPILGIYTAMTESEFHECLTSPMGAKGVFQILPATMKKYGGDPNDLCSLKPSAMIAARYHNKLIKDYGANGLGFALTVLSYNQGEGAVQKEVASRLGKEKGEADFWSLMFNPNAANLSDNMTREGSKYVLKFYAAVIVGENPESFGIQSKPLSSF